MNIVICCDGTSQKLDVEKTNVASLFSILNLEDSKTQIGCYDPGVGTIPASGALTWVSSSYTLWMGKAVGYGLLENVAEMYEFLIDRYNEGDRIYLFGFSRGAFTVRVLAGLLYRCGVLKRDARNLIPYALELYKPHYEHFRDDKKLEKFKRVIKEFRGIFARPCDVKVEFLGIWDTVKSFGYLWPKSLPHTRHNPIVKTVRHALSIDERRSFFVLTSWGGIDNETQPPLQGQDVQEVWFTGVHSDVGGGYEEAESGLAKISLKWMINEAFRCGLCVDKTKYKEMFAQDPTPPFTPHDEVKKWKWRVAERLPRWELVNDPPPPTRLFRWRPAGRRPIGDFTRDRMIIRIHSSARELYTVDLAPWSDFDSKQIKVEWVDTIDRVGV